MADKTPVRYAYDGSSLTGIAEYATSDTVGVGFGGTGATSLTDNGVLIGNATSAIQVTSALTTNGQIVIGGTSGPAVANISGTSNEVEITNADGTITIGLPSALCSTGTLEIGGNVSFDGGSFVFNDAGADKDFRIEGDTDANLFIADASTDRIGIGTATPSHLLDVEGVANVATCIITPKICVPTAGFNSGYALPGADGSAGQIMCTDGSGALAFATASAGVTLAGSTNNTVATVTGSDALAGEANLTFDGSTLGVAGAVTITKNNDYGVSVYDGSNAGGTIGLQTLTADGNGGWLNKNVYYNGSAWVVNDNSVGAVAVALDPTGNFRVQTQASGSSLPTERFRVTCAGKVGIGTAAPAAPLHVVGEMRMNDDYAISWGGDQSKIMGNDANDTLSLRTYNGDRLFITCGECSAVNIGIGTTNTVNSWGDPDVGAMLMVQASVGANYAIAARNSYTSYNILTHSTHGAVTGTNVENYMESSSPAAGDFAGSYVAMYKLCEGTKSQLGSFGWFADNICPTGKTSRFYLRTYSNNVAYGPTVSSTGVWTDASAEAQKEYEGTRQEIWPDGILPKIKNLSVSKYHAAGIEEGVEITETHVSPSAENFWDTLGIGINPRSLIENKDGENTVIPGLAAKDLAGVALVGIQELLDRIESLETEVAILKG